MVPPRKLESNTINTDLFPPIKHSPVITASLRLVLLRSLANLFLYEFLGEKSLGLVDSIHLFIS